MKHRIPDIGETVYTVGELKAFLNMLDDNDCVVIDTIDDNDIFPFHMDVINGIKMMDGTIIREVRFCQENNI